MKLESCVQNPHGNAQRCQKIRPLRLKSDLSGQDHAGVGLGDGGRLDQCTF
jgi:hypothetical protein